MENFIQFILKEENPTSQQHHEKLSLGTPRFSVKKVLLEISRNSQENTCARVSFLIKLQVFSWCFTGVFLWIFRNFYLQNTSGRMLLYKVKAYMVKETNKTFLSEQIVMWQGTNIKFWVITLACLRWTCRLSIQSRWKKYWFTDDLLK